MNPPDKLYVAATGMITPIGMNTEMTAASMDAAISGYQVSDFYNKKSKPITAAIVPDAALPPLHKALESRGLRGIEKRIIKLSHVALNEIKPKLPTGSSIPLFLAGPEADSALVKPITADLIRHIQTQTEFEFDLDSSQVLTQGRAGVICAVELAFQYLNTKDDAFVLVGGVDSYLDPNLISQLDAEDRILAENIVDGFAIGEAAGFLLLSNKYHHWCLPATLSYPGIAQEKGHLYSNEPYKGDGLAQAFNLAINNSDDKKIDKLFSSMNGESYFVKELGISRLRYGNKLMKDYQYFHPADCFGDLGAAIGAVLLALSVVRHKASKTPIKNLVCCSSDSSSRAAICTNSLL